MKNDPIKQYVQLRQKLESERTAIVARLKEIEAALGSPLVKAAVATATVAAAPRTRTRKRAQNSLSLKEAILQVTSKQALTKNEILDAIQKAGYKFETNNPLNSIGTVLYGKSPKFKNNDGKFSPLKG